MYVRLYVCMCVCAHARSNYTYTIHQKEEAHVCCSIPVFGGADEASDSVVTTCMRGCNSCSTSCSTRSNTLQHLPADRWEHRISSPSPNFLRMTQPGRTSLFPSLRSLYGAVTERVLNPSHENKSDNSVALVVTFDWFGSRAVLVASCYTTALSVSGLSTVCNRIFSTILTAKCVVRCVASSSLIPVSHLALQ
jgi:hypothetical protein